MDKARIAVLVSGGGTNLQALIDAEHSGILTSGEIVLVCSSNPDAFALTRAKNNGIETHVIENEQDLISQLESHNIDLIILAGFMTILSPEVIKRYPERIINVHPALIPSFCGKGFYGLKVHEKALEYGVKVTGATVHFVNEIPDGGKIIYQKAIDILDDDTPQSLQKRVMENCEWILLPKAAEKVSKEIVGSREK
ncbi:MAG: phosphoribosylglycinamide formyltransferase [Eubacterium sp.]|nr:phosphoribosylglycinamide formyltransferase [Eubacterium sp.]